MSGALAALADGVFDGFIDMPTLERKAGGNEIDVAGLSRSIRELRARHEGAYFVAVLEAVGPRPGKDGAMQAFRFGESFGVIKGVIGTLGIPVVMTHPQSWKRRLSMLGTEKDYSRTLAVQTFPAASEHLQRKKDVGRADALLIAHWAELTEAVGPATTSRRADARRAASDR